jgi:hypothetical protein
LPIARLTYGISCSFSGYTLTNRCRVAPNELIAAENRNRFS